MLEEEKIQAGTRTEAIEDHLLMRGSYKVHPNVKNNTSHILLALPFFLCVRLQPDFKIQKKLTHEEIALQLSLVCLTFICMKRCPVEAVGAKCSFWCKI